MNIRAQIEQRGIEYEIRWYVDGRQDLTFMDAEGNLGTMLTFELFNITYHFWDANGCVYSPSRPFMDLDEMLAEFDKLLLDYYADDFSRFADWQLMELNS